MHKDKLISRKDLLKEETGKVSLFSAHAVVLTYKEGGREKRRQPCSFTKVLTELGKNPPAQIVPDLLMRPSWSEGDQGKASR